jgi:hypothetical protein
VLQVPAEQQHHAEAAGQAGPSEHPKTPEHSRAHRLGFQASPRQTQANISVTCRGSVYMLELASHECFVATHPLRDDRECATRKRVGRYSVELSS